MDGRGGGETPPPHTLVKKWMRTIQNSFHVSYSGEILSVAGFWEQAGMCKDVLIHLYINNLSLLKFQFACYLQEYFIGVPNNQEWLP